MNDPFDCKIDIRRSLVAAVKKAEREGSPAVRANLDKLGKLGDFYSKTETDIGKVGVFSLAQSEVNSPLWAHYASNHKGLCLGFRLSEKLRKHGKAECIIGMVSVKYCKTNPFVKFFFEFASRNSPDQNEIEVTRAMQDESWQEILATGMTSKSKHWKYEHEVRVLRKEGGLVSFEPGELVEVVFGMDMPAPARETVWKLLASHKWKHVKLKEIQRGPGFTLHAVGI